MQVVINLFESLSTILIDFLLCEPISYFTYCFLIGLIIKLFISPFLGFRK